MRRLLLISTFALAVGAALASPLGDQGGPQTCLPTVYEANPHVAIGALRLDITTKPEGRIPHGWRHADAARRTSRPDPYHLVKFSGPVGSRHRELLAEAGYSVVSYHPFNTFLVRPEQGRQLTALSSVDGVSWTGRFHPYFKIPHVLADALEAGDVSRHVVAEDDWGLRFSIWLHEDDARRVVEASLAAAPGMLELLPTRTLPIRVRVAPERFTTFLQHAAALPEVVFIAPWIPAHESNDENAQTSQSGSCVQDGVEAPNTTIFNRGITGWNARLAIADSCADVNSGFWYDDALGRLSAHEPSAPWQSTEPDWSQRKILEYYDMYSQDTAIGCPDDEEDHGSHTAGTMTGNCSLDPEGTATRTDAANSDGDQDGMAPGAYLIVQDLDHVKYITHDGGTPGELFDVAYDNTCLDGDCGIDAHSNSWGSATDLYDDYAFTADRSLWNTQRGLIVASSGNFDSDYGTVETPASAKSVIAVGNGDDCVVDKVFGSSGRGPTGDGRLYPDVIAGGFDVTSVNNDGDNTNTNGGCLRDKTLSGTSMSAPTVSGLSALVLQYFNDGFYPGGTATPFDTLEPSGPLAKAMLINTAQRMTHANSAERNGVSWPNMDQGWGFVVLENSLYFPGDSRKLWIHDEAVGVDVTESSTSMTFRRMVTSAAEPLKVTLVWYDAPHAGGCGSGIPCLDNDLDLAVTEPIGGDTWSSTLVDGTAGHVVPRTVVPGPPAGIGQTLTNNGPDDLNTVEQIIIYDPTPGRVYEFTVTASNTPDGPIPFALVATGALDDPCTPPTGASPITVADIDTCGSDGVEVTWGQDVTSWNDGESGTRYYRVWRDGMPIRSGPCAGNLPYGTTSCIDDGAPVTYPDDYRVEYVSGCGTTVKTAEVAATDIVPFLVDVTPNNSDVCPDAAVQLTANVDLPGSYTYQWTEDGLDLPGETSSTLTISKGAPESHEYNCRLTDSASCAREDLTPTIATWIDDPANIVFSTPQVSFEQLCGDGDPTVEPGEIWNVEFGVVNTSTCNTAANVTADLEVSASSGASAEMCKADGEFGDLAPQAVAADTLVFKAEETSACPGVLFFDVANITWDGGGPNDAEQAFGVLVGGSCDVTTVCDCSTIFADEVSPIGSSQPLIVTRNGSLIDLKFKRATGAAKHNVYVSTDASTLPFQVTDSAVGKKSCDVPWQAQFGGAGTITGYDVESGIAPSDIYYILMTGDNGAPTEGTLGFTSDSTERDADSRCTD